MKRGVVQLNADTKAQLRQLDQSKLSQTLLAKIESLSDAVFYLELSQEEVETILDMLPTPDKASPATNQLRYQLGKFLI